MSDLYTTLLSDSRYKDAFNHVRLFGVAGTNGSGKDTLLELLGEHGLLLFNTGDSLRQISQAVLGSTQRGGNDSPVGRIANSERSRYPGGMVELGMIDYWVRILHLPKELQPKGLAIGSIRAVGEAQRLKEFGGKLVVVDADPQIRFERLKSRSRSYEKEISFEQFAKEEAAEMAVGETDPHKFGMAQVISMADITITNNGNDIKAFKDAVERQLDLA